jgi:ABC-2 type transport system permease protein
MFKFHFLRSMRDVVGHLILIAVPVLLIAFFNFIFSGRLAQLGMPENPLPYLSVLTIGFALTFQIYGASISFEVIGDDFFTHKRDRLLASPAEPRAVIVSTLTVGCIVSFLQTLAVLLFSSLVLKADLGALHLTLPIFLVSVIFHQLLGTVILLISGSVKTSNSILTMYGAIVPMSVGLYFPLPRSAFFDVLKLYLSPMALANTAVLGAMEGDTLKVSIGVAALVIMSGGLYIALRPLIRRLDI